ncbi:MAG: hypothetical protein V1845_01440 [bacterium]
MATKIKAEWTGVIAVDPFELDCRLTPAIGRVKPLPIVEVHFGCHTVLTPPKTKEAGAEAQEEKDTEAVCVREQIFCPKCQRPLKTDEIGCGIDMASGVVQITDAEIASLKFEPTKRVFSQFIPDNDPTLETIGFSRRLHVYPKPASVDSYFNIFHLLRDSNSLGFIPLIVIKRVPNVAVIRPLEIPAVIFGQKRLCLVVDILNDTDRLRDPAEFPDFTPIAAVPDFKRLAQPMADTMKNAKPLDPERCVSPRRAKIKAIINAAVARSLKR